MTTEERLDRIESTLENLVDALTAQRQATDNLLEIQRNQGQATDNLLEIQRNQGQSIDRLIEGQLYLQGMQGQLAEQTLQLKRAVDYLLSKDGERSS